MTPKLPEVSAKARPPRAWAIGRYGLALVVLATAAHAGTAMLVDFEHGYDAAFSLGDRKPIEVPAHPLVEGKFGRGFLLNASCPRLRYRLDRVLEGSGGAVEFWYRPQWDGSTIYEHAPSGNLSLKGKRLNVRLFVIGEYPGIQLTKDRYNSLGLYVIRSYRVVSRVAARGATLFQKGKWIHLAVSWDTHEARLFANGRLLALSDLWTLDYIGKTITLGSFYGGAGVYDEIRISDHKRYVSSFPLPHGPHRIETRAEEMASRPVAPLAEATRRAFGEAAVTFAIDFSQGLSAQYACGSSLGRSNRRLPVEAVAGRPRVRLRTRAGEVGDTLCFEREGNLNRFLGTVEIGIRPAEGFTLPAVLFDCAHTASYYGTRTGVRLLLNEEGCLEWQSLANGRVVSRVQSAPLALEAESDVALGLSWAGSTIALYRDGREIKRQKGCAIPAAMDAYFFIGSDTFGENTLDGWIDHVIVSRTPKPVRGPQKLTSIKPDTLGHAQPK